MLRDVQTLEWQNRRVDALYFVYRLLPQSPERESLLGALIANASGCEPWRCCYIPYAIVTEVRRSNPRRARTIAESMPDGRYRLKALRDLAAAL
jgi:hypothetical protein